MSKEGQLSLYERIFVNINTLGGNEYLSNKYGFSKYDLARFDRYRPLFEVHQLEEKEVIDELSLEKQQFIYENGIDEHDIIDNSMFYRYNSQLQILNEALAEYLQCLKSGAFFFGYKFKDMNFIELRLQSEKDNPYKTMLVTGLTPAQLEIYLQNTLATINSFLNKSIVETNTPKKNKPEKEWTFVNNFDNVSPEKVYTHFYKMVENKWLNEGELKSFLTNAFEKQIPPSHKISLANRRHKSDVIRIFYKYYKYIASKTQGRQKDYIALFQNHFQGFENTDYSTNFSKYDY